MFCVENEGLLKKTKENTGWEGAVNGKMKLLHSKTDVLYAEYRFC